MAYGSKDSGQRRRVWWWIVGLMVLAVAIIIGWVFGMMRWNRLDFNGVQYGDHVSTVPGLVKWSGDDKMYYLRSGDAGADWERTFDGIEVHRVVYCFRDDTFCEGMVTLSGDLQYIAFSKMLEEKYGASYHKENTKNKEETISIWLRFPNIIIVFDKESEHPRRRVHFTALTEIITDMMDD